MRTKLLFAIALFTTSFSLLAFGGTEAPPPTSGVTDGPGDLVSELRIRRAYGDPGKSMLIVFEHHHKLFGNFIFFAQSKEALLELTQLEFTGGLSQSGAGDSLDLHHSREFISSNGEIGILFFVKDGVYVLSGGKSSFIPTLDKSKYPDLLKAKKVQITLLPPVRENQYIFKVQNEDLYITMDYSSQGNQRDFEVFAGKAGKVEPVGSGKASLKSEEDEIVLSALGTITGKFLSGEAQLTTQDGKTKQLKVIGMGTNSAQQAIRLGVPESRFRRPQMSNQTCDAMLGVGQPALKP